jgi:hypothetical protein
MPVTRQGGKLVVFGLAKSRRWFERPIGTTPYLSNLFSPRPWQNLSHG